MGTTNSVARKDLKFLLANTAYDRATIISWHQEFKNECPSGKLSLEGFQNYYSHFFPSGNGDEFCEHMFRAFDTDENGFIDFKEFLLAIYITSAGSQEHKIQTAFRYFLYDFNIYLY